MTDKITISSGVEHLDRMLDGLWIGDNVVWHDDAGSLARIFCMSFLDISREKGKPVIYVSFDRPPKTLMEKLGDSASSPDLVILDCFTNGKGDSSPVFKKFYAEQAERLPCRVTEVQNPRDMGAVRDLLYDVHSGLSGDVRFIFDSLTGMQELWGGEDQITAFYSHSCPRLYELQTVAYWIMEKNAHSSRLKAKISQIAQVVVELSVKRGTTTLSILKADGREMADIQKPAVYWTRNGNIVFGDDKRTGGGFDLGLRIKELRTRKGISQTELSRFVGVTPSTISQVESNLIFPSLPALFKMAEVLGVGAASFFQNPEEKKRRVVYPESESQTVRLQGDAEEKIQARRITPIDFDGRIEAYLIEIPPDGHLPSHFFLHKGEETGYLLAGRLEFRTNGSIHAASPGDLISLVTETPAAWKNTGPENARLLWFKIL